MKNRLIFLLLVSLLALAACNRGEVTDVQRNPEGGVDVTAQLSETEISEAITDALAEDNPLLRDPQVDLQPGQIVINGQHDQRDGSGTVSGSLTVNLSIQNGAILATVTQVNIQGVDLSDTRIANINSRIAERVTRRADREGRNITVQSVTISDTMVEVQFNITRT
jgi:hypothetical protein